MSDQTQEAGQSAAPAGYLALPGGGVGPAVLVLHAWWGLNDTIKAVCRRLAAEGFVAFAPDLYHGETADTIEGAEARVQALNQVRERAAGEVAAAARYLSAGAGEDGGGVAVIGFSLGASYALDLAAADPGHVEAVVLFYGTGGGDFSTCQAAFLGHFAADDPYEERQWIDMLEEELLGTGRPVTFHHYPDVGHWFFEPDRADAYDEEAAELAWERTLAFLRETSL